MGSHMYEYRLSLPPTPSVSLYKNLAYTGHIYHKYITETNKHHKEYNTNCSNLM